MLFWVILFWILCGYTMATFGVLASLRAPHQPPLPDLGFDLVRFLPNTQLQNIGLSFIVFVTVIRIIAHPLRVKKSF